MMKLKFTNALLGLIILFCGIFTVNGFAKETEILEDDTALVWDIEGNCESIMETSEVVEKTIEPFFPKSPESVIGPDNRTRVYNTTASPYSAICYVEATFPNNITYVGTAWLYGDSVATTAAHVVYSSADGGWAKTVKLYPGNNGSSAPFGVVQVKEMSVPNSWKTKRDPDSDYAALILKTNTGSQTGWFGVESGSNSLINTKVTVTGYPGDEKQGQLWTATGTVTSSYENSLYYNADTTGGQSGSPVYKSNLKVVAIHAYGAASENSGARINTKVYKFLWNARENSGWVTENGKKYYYENGKKATGAKKISGAWYYFDPKNGNAMHTGWRTDGSIKYYYLTDGKLAMGAQNIGKDWYYFNPNNGTMFTGWRTEGSTTYYYLTDGKLARGAQNIGKDWYYFNTVNGIMFTGWRTEGTSKYYYLTDGKLAMGAQNIGQDWYYFNTINGIMFTGWRTEGSAKYYYLTDGKLARGGYNIGQDWYYFNTNGTMYIGWRTENGTTYYYHTDGKLAFGSQIINNKEYYFNLANGKMIVNQWVNGVYYGADGVRTN